MLILRMLPLVLATLWQAGADAGDGGEPDNDAGNTGDPPGNNGGTGDKTFTQADVDRIVSDRLGRERNKLRDEIKAELDREREDASLKEREEYKPLYEKAANDLKRYEGLEENLTTMRETLETVYKAQLADLPDATRKLAAGLEEKLDVIERLKWVADLPDEFKKPRVKGIPDSDADSDDKGGDVTATMGKSYVSAAYSSVFGKKTQ